MSSPIDGRIGLAQVKIGNLVGPTGVGGSDYTELAVVRQLDPMGIDIQASSCYSRPGVAKLIDQGLTFEIYRPGHRGGPGPPLPRQGDGDRQHDQSVHVHLPDAGGDRQPEQDPPALGEYVKANAKVGEVRDAIVVPEQAVVEMQAGPAVYTVDDQGKVEYHPRPGNPHLRRPSRRRIGSRTRHQRVIVDGTATGPQRDDRQEEPGPSWLRRRPSHPKPEVKAAEKGDLRAHRASPPPKGEPRAQVRLPRFPDSSCELDADSRLRERHEPWSTSSSAARFSPPWWRC